jgi:hypothetical protein
MKPSLIPIFLAIALSLTACASNQVAVPGQAGSGPAPTGTPVPPTEAPDTQPAEQTVSGLPELTDDQGAVVVTVKPLDLGDQDEQLQFEVALNTHSVDLSMDLAALATLATDTGLTVQASAWDAPRGGHHVSGRLSFPSQVDGKSLLDGTSRLTLVIKGVDVSERTFLWELE